MLGRGHMVFLCETAINQRYLRRHLNVTGWGGNVLLFLFCIYFQIEIYFGVTSRTQKIIHIAFKRFEGFLMLFNFLP